jgi:hypothetical protein
LDLHDAELFIGGREDDSDLTGSNSTVDANLLLLNKLSPVERPPGRSNALNQVDVPQFFRMFSGKPVTLTAPLFTHLPRPRLRAGTLPACF